MITEEEKRLEKKFAKGGVSLSNIYTILRKKGYSKKRSEEIVNGIIKRQFHKK